MRYFPLFFDMKNRRVVVVGGGEAAAQKLRLLLKTEARIDVIAGELTDEITEYVENGRVKWLAKAFAPKLIEGANLVYATQGEAENVIVAKAARAKKILVNAVDMPELCDVITPAIVDRDPVVVAIGTEGAAPVLARQIKSHLEGHLPQNLGVMAKAARNLRKTVAATLATSKLRRTFWEKFWEITTKPLFLVGKTRAANMVANTLLRIIERSASGGIPGRVSLVGAGPGAADLLTFRAMQRLQSADVIVCDSSIDAAILECARRDAVRIITKPDYSNKVDIKSILIEEALKGQHVVFIKNVNTAYLSSMSEKLHVLESAGATIDIVPGVAVEIAPVVKPMENTKTLIRHRPANIASVVDTVPVPQV